MAFPPHKTLVGGYKFCIFLGEDENIHSLGSLNEAMKLRGEPILSKLTKIVAIDCGEEFFLALDYYQQVWATGKNDNYQLGVDVPQKSNEPVQVQLPPIQSIVCGGRFSICLDTNNDVWSFGHNSIGQCGRGSADTKLKVGKINLSNIDFIAAGGNHGFCLNFDGILYGFGDNSNGQLFVEKDDTGIRHHRKPTIASRAPKNIKKIACGWSHTVFLTDINEIFSHQASFASTLTKIELPEITDVICSNNCSACLDFDGNVWTFGINHPTRGNKKVDENQLGFELKPANLDLKEIVLLQGSGGQFFAKDSFDRYFSWGTNCVSQLGRRGNINPEVPTEVDPKIFNVKLLKDCSNKFNRAKSAKK